MLKFRSQYDYISDDQDYEFLSTEGDKTIPNCALSVKELLRRFSNGTLTPMDLNSNYYDSDDNDIDKPLPQFEDLTDLSDISHNVGKIIDNIKAESSNLNEDTP